MKQLLLLTTSFPFGQGEDFLTEELRHFCGFDECIVCACHAPGDAARTKPVPEGIQVVRLEPRLDGVSYPAVAMKGDVWGELAVLAGNKKLSGGRIHELLFFCRKAEAVLRELRVKVLPLLTAGEITVYSYWLYDAALAGAKLAELLRRQGKRVRLVSRAHGFDAFPERAKYGYLPMRKALLTACSKVYACSHPAAEAVRAACPQAADRVSVSCLGTAGPTPPYGRRGPQLHVVTCSYLVPVKRILLFVQALALVRIPVCWTHIGSGPQEKEVRAAAASLPGNIAWQLKGHMENRALLAYYENEPVSCVVNVSASEGLPVSLMEACSFGFPAVATRVGGTFEAVQDRRTGFLLPANPTPEEIASALLSLARMEEGEYRAMCENARRLWEEKFDAAANYARFYHSLSAEGGTT